MEPVPPALHSPPNHYGIRQLEGTVQNVFQNVPFSAPSPALSVYTHPPTATHQACSNGPGPLLPSPPLRPPPHSTPATPASSLCLGDPRLKSHSAYLSSTVYSWILPLVIILVLPKTAHLQRPHPFDPRHSQKVPFSSSAHLYLKRSHVLSALCLPHWSISLRVARPLLLLSPAGLLRPKQSLAHGKCLTAIY